MHRINGLLYYEAYISEKAHEKLILTIDGLFWQSNLSRRTQHYGYLYDYRTRKIDTSMHLGRLPKWLQSIANKLYTDKLISAVPDQAIINEYLPGQGIANHIDCEPCFGDTIISLSLGASAIMDFTREGKKISLLLEPCSVLILKDEARYLWKHGIARRKKDVWQGSTILRKRRISITFRKAILS